MTSAERWGEIRAVFEAALSQPPEFRAAFLSARCGGDPALRTEVEALLEGAVHDSFLDTPAVGEAARALEGLAPEPIGARVGPFRLTELIGQGGMGRVFLAERADGAFEQRVAVKLIRSVFATPELLRRFERERSILASLSHPNIAHLLDGGISDLGPYLAMELIGDGSTVLEFCDEGRWDLRNRVELFATVCEAVHAAHQQAIVHRDLKPGNVLVTPDGHVKLLDFGIAGLLGVAEGTAEELTRPGQALMTPEYASPEQIRGEPVPTASDVYALGVMLYELLTGQRPYDLRSLSPAEVERRVSEGSTEPSDAVAENGVAPLTGEPATPQAVSSARATRPDRLRRALRGDLDTIVQKAMHRDPARRYVSAAALAEDLRRFRAKMPILARPDTVGYRLASFGRRRRGAVIATGVVVATVIGGTVTTQIQARQGDTRFEDGRQLATSILSRLDAALEDVPGSTTVRARLVSEALEYLDGLSADPRADREHLLDVADAYDQVGEIQGDPTSTNLGDLAAARASYEQAQSIRESLWLLDSTDVRTRIGVAASQHKAAIVAAFQGDLQGSTELARIGLDYLKPLEPTRSGSDPAAITGARLRTVVGENLINDGQWTTGPAMLDTAVAMLEAAVADEPDDARLKLDLWGAYNGQATVLWYTRRAAAGLELLEGRACPMLRDLVAEYPNRGSARYGLQQCRDHSGQMLEQLGRLDESEEAFRDALGLAESLVELDTSNEGAHEAVSASYLALGRLLFRMDRPDEGRTALDRTIEISEALRRANPTNERWTFQVGTVQRELCRGLIQANMASEAIPICLAAADNHGRAAGKGPGVITSVTYAFALAQAGRAFRALAGDADDEIERRILTDLAIARYEESLDWYRQVGNLGPEAAWEIHPDTAEAELESLRVGARPAPAPRQ